MSEKENDRETEISRASGGRATTRFEKWPEFMPGRTVAKLVAEHNALVAQLQFSEMCGETALVGTELDVIRLLDNRKRLMKAKVESDKFYRQAVEVQTSQREAYEKEIARLTTELAETRKLGMEAVKMRFEENTRLAGIIQSLRKHLYDDSRDCAVLCDDDEHQFPSCWYCDLNEEMNCAIPMVIQYLNDLEGRNQPVSTKASDAPALAPKPMGKVQHDLDRALLKENCKPKPDYGVETGDLEARQMIHSAPKPAEPDLTMRGTTMLVNLGKKETPEEDFTDVDDDDQEGE
jgi:hypothetical protein